jgi:hypothetical protein
MDTSSLIMDSTQEEAPRGARLASMVGRASLVAALLTYVALPFFHNPLRGTTLWGSEFFGLSIGYVLSGAGPEQLKFIVGFGLPALTAIAGAILWTRPGRGVAMARLVCAATALGALTFGYLQFPGDWLYGFYATDGALAIATTASALTFLGALAGRTGW